ncbi:MAG: SUMF1/EgtB/PvdO family nonheme iron enzyme [Polyangiaceae bacterium]
MRGAFLVYLVPACAVLVGLACSTAGTGAPPPAASATEAAAAAESSTIAAQSATASPSATPAPTASAVTALASAAPEPAEKPPCPPSMTLVGRFCIDTYEAELEVQTPDGSWAPHPHWERPPEGKTFRAVNAAGAFPQGYISQKESAAACKESGKRLCTKGEWQRACKGKGWMRYPYGSQAIKGKCNSSKQHLLSIMFKNPPKGMTYEIFNAPELNKEPGWLSKSGEYPDCASELGVFDMVGNLHEWVSDKVTDQLIDDMEAEKVERHKQPHAVGNGVFMGGFYSTTSELGPGCLYITVAHEPSYHDYSTGFRCCAAADLPKPPPKAPKPGVKPGASASSR